MNFLPKALGAFFILYTTSAIASDKLETVVVLGEKSQRLVSETVSMVGVIPAEVLQSGSIEHPNQVFAATPGVWVSRGNGQEHLTAIRSPVFTGAGACGAFAMTENGIALRANGFCNVNQLFDSHYEAASMVEVLKGPHSSLVGGNAQFGAINIHLPAADQVANRVRLSGSSAGFRQLHGQFGTSFANHAVAALATAKEEDGMQVSSGFKQQKLSLRHLWTGPGWLSVESGLSVMNLEQETAGYIEGEDAYKNTAQRQQNSFPDAYRDADAVRLYSRWRLRQLDREWVFTPYYRRNKMAFLMHFVPWMPTEENNHESLGWQLQWRRLLPQGGEIYLGQEAERTWGNLLETQSRTAPFSAQNYPVGSHYDFSVLADSVAINAGGFGHLTRDLAVDAAVRLDYTRFDYTNHLAAGSACGPEANACRFYRPPSGVDEFREPSAHFGLVHQWANNLFWFAKAASAYRFPQVAELYRLQSPVSQGIKAETMRSIEAGIRGQSKNWFLQTALFAMENKHGIIQNPERRFVNGVDSAHIGLEYELVYGGDSPWEFELTGQFANHTYENNPNLLGVDILLKGKQMDTAPKLSHNLKIAYQLGDDQRLGLSTQWLGKYYLDPQNAFTYKGHYLSDIEWHKNVTEDLAVDIKVLNVFDRRYAERADAAFGQYRYFPGLERRLSIALQYQF